jgi:hypothetical protein
VWGIGRFFVYKNGIEMGGIMIVESENATVKSKRLHSAEIAIALIIVLSLEIFQIKALYGKMADESIGFLSLILRMFTTK